MKEEVDIRLYEFLKDGLLVFGEDTYERAKLVALTPRWVSNNTHNYEEYWSVPLDELERIAFEDVEELGTYLLSYMDMRTGGSTWMIVLGHELLTENLHRDKLIEEGKLYEFSEYYG